MVETEEETEEVEIVPLGYNVRLTKEEQAFLEAFRVRNQSGPSMEPLACHEECTLRATCPLVHIGKKPPNGAVCPIEQMMGEDWMKQLKSELRVTDPNSIDALLLREIVNWMLMENRYYHEFARNPNAAERTMRGVDKKGDPIFDIKPNPVLKSLKESSARKAAALRSLIATRLEKEKMRPAAKDEATVVAAQIMKRLKEMEAKNKEKRKLLDSRTGDIEDAEFQTKD